MGRLLLFLIILILAGAMYCSRDFPTKQFLPECNNFPVYRKPQSKSVQLGEIHYFCRTTATHGFAHVVDKDELCWLRVFWILVVLFFTTAACRMIVMSTKELLSRTLTSEFLERTPLPDSSSVLPDIHICDTSIFSNSRMNEMGFNRTMATYLLLATSTNAANPAFIRNLTYREALSSELEQYFNRSTITLKSAIDKAAIRCEDLIKGCNIAGEFYTNQNCCEIYFRPKPYVSIYGSCFSTTGKSIEQKLESRDAGFTVYAIPNKDIVEYDSKLIKGEYILQQGIYFAVSSETENVALVLPANGRFATLGTWVSVPITKSEVDNSELKGNMLAPYSCVHKTDVNYRETLIAGYPSYSQTNCFLSYWQALYQESKNCSAIFYRYGNSSKFCTPQDIMSFNASKIVKNSERCPVDCLTEHYDVAPSYATYNYKIAVREYNLNVSSDSIIALNFFYPTFKYSVKKNRPATYLKWLGEVGGNLGLFLGGSLISILEVVALFVRCCLKFRRQTQLHVI